MNLDDTYYKSVYFKNLFVLLICERICRGYSGHVHIKICGFRKKIQYLKNSDCGSIISVKDTEVKRDDSGEPSQESDS